MKKLKQHKDVSNIAVSLTRGKFNGESRKKIIIPYIILIIMCAALAIIDIVMSIIRYVNNDTISISSFLSGLFLFPSIAAILPLVLFILIHRNEKIRRDIYVWLDDAVELNAYCRNIGVKESMFIKLIKLQVEFEFDGKNYVRTTENEKRGILDYGSPVGYFSGVSKYANKEVKILYSPKYDEVMILKN